MFNNTAIDVVIGLFFIYLLYSLLATIILEIIAQFLSLRARMLIKTVRVLLEDRKNTQRSFIMRLLFHVGNNIYHFFCPLSKNSLSKAFFSSPSIKYLAQSSWKSKPSYIGAANFSTTLIRLLRGESYDGAEPQMNAIYRTLFEQKKVEGEGTLITDIEIEPETLLHLKQLYIDAQKDIDRFKALLERWFEETMERAGGWYKQQTQWILLLIGFIVAVTFNVDTVAISTILSKDKRARENMVQLAINATPKYDSLVKKLQLTNPADTVFYPPTTVSGVQTTGRMVIKDTVYIALNNEELNDAYTIVKADIDKAIGITGLGWPDQDSCKVCDSLKTRLSSVNNPAENINLKKKINYYNIKFNCSGNPYQKGGIIKLLGWLLTALAISLGAPFWFDLLNKFIQLRSSIAKPKEADTGGGASKIDDSSTSSRIRVG